MVAGAKGPTDFERFGRLKLRFLKKFPLYEILMIAVCAMIDGAKGPTFGVASLRSVSVASVQQFSVQWEADGSPLPTGRRLLAAGCWNTSAAGRLEDRSRARREDLAENLAMLRHVVINVLRLDKSVFGGISVKRKELTWDDEKLLGLMLAA